MTADRFVLVPPESPVLNGGDWLDLGTMESDDREPQPSDGPDYHADHDAWVRRRSGRVPVVPTWTCPTCGGSGTSGPEFVDEFGASPCLDCEGEGVVSQGWLALGAAAEECPHHKQFRESGRIQLGWTCPRYGCTGSVPASLSELVRVQRVLVVDNWMDAGGRSCVEVWIESVVYWPANRETGVDITDQFTVKPNPGGWVWRIVERVTLSDPITGYPCPTCTARYTGRRVGRLLDGLPCEACGGQRATSATGFKNIDGTGRVPLPQQVGWYQADDALRDEIERRR